MDPTLFNQALLDQLKAGSAVAQAQVYGALRAEVTAIGARLGLGAIDAESMAADLFIDFFFRFVQEVRAPAAIPAYLKMMAVRRGHRLKRRAEREAATEEQDRIDPEARSPDEALELQRYLKWLDACLEGLTPRARSVLKLQYGHALSFAQAGEHLGVSKQAVHKISSKSVELLRRCIESKEGARA